jgi:hypothetical protein
VARLLNFLALLAAIVAFSLASNDADPDLWHRLAVGGVYYSDGVVLDRDVFAYTPTLARWVDHEWGCGVIFFGWVHAFGPEALVFVKAVLFALALAMAALASRARPSLLRQTFPAALSFFLWVAWAMAPGYSTTLRCQAFTYLGFALLVWRMEGARRGWAIGRRDYVWLVAGFVCWANLHGGYLAGLGLLALYGLGFWLEGRDARPCLIGLALAAAATLINPYGVALWGNVTDALSRERTQMMEWLPLFQAGTVWSFLGVKTLLAAALAAGGFQIALSVARRKRHRVPWTPLIVMGVTAFLALESVRHLPLFAIASAAFLPRWMREAWLAIVRKRPPKGARPNLAATAARLALPAVAMVLGMAALLELPWRPRLDRTTYAAGAVDFLRAGGYRGRLAVPFNTSSYALFRLFPDCRVNIDGRFEQTYPPEVFAASTAFHYGNSGAFLERYGADIVIAGNGTPAEGFMSRRGGWSVVFRDDDATVFAPDFPFRVSHRPAPIPGPFDTADFLRRWKAFAE